MRGCGAGERGSGPRAPIIALPRTYNKTPKHNSSLGNITPRPSNYLSSLLKSNICNQRACLDQGVELNAPPRQENQYLTLLDQWSTAAPIQELQVAHITTQLSPNFWTLINFTFTHIYSTCCTDCCTTVSGDCDSRSNPKICAKASVSGFHPMFLRR